MTRPSDAASPYPRENVREYRKTATVMAGQAPTGGVIPTLEGDHTYEAGDYIAGPGAAGEYWPVRRDIFEATYALVTPVRPSDAASLRDAAQRLIDYLDVREHHEDDTGIRRVHAASRPYVSDLRAVLAAPVASADACPVCGTPGEVISSDEGTSYFRAAIRGTASPLDVERLAERLDGYRADDGRYTPPLIEEGGTPGRPGVFRLATTEEWVARLSSDETETA